MSSYAKAQMGSVGVCVGLFIYTLGTNPSDININTIQIVQYLKKIISYSYTLPFKRLG